MRDLNAINVSAKSTKFAFTISLIMPLIMGLGGWALADGAAPTLPLRDNYLEMLSFGIIAIAIVALPIPHVFKWNWETRYFGALMFSLGSFSIMGIYPLLCIIQFSPLPLLVRLSIALLVSVVTIRWCARIVKTYKAIYADKRLFNCIYEEESTAVYYLQQGDRKIFEKKFKIELFPTSKYALCCFLGAFSLIPFASPVSQFIGLPFTHIFLAVFGVPLDLMFIGIVTKMWLVYYFYPSKIRKETNKPIYVDMSSQPLKCVNSKS